MKITVYNENFVKNKTLDIFSSLIWTDKYIGFGEFELVVPATLNMIYLLIAGRYLSIKESEHMMVIEDVQLQTGWETGDRLIVKGRSLESILDRRVVIQQKLLQGDLQDALHDLLDENIINPVSTNRKIDNFIFEESDDTAVTSLTVDTQFTGDSIYSVIEQICLANQLGFKITLNSSDQLVFKLYMGKDRSYDQLSNPYIVFAPKNENLISSDYKDVSSTLKTVTYVGGEGEGSERTILMVPSEDGEKTGLNRREIFTDAKGISATVSGGTLTPEEYLAQLYQKGLENLAKNVENISFDAQLDPEKSFVYGEDYFLGDLVQILNQYGIGSKTRVIEEIYSQDLNGIRIYPTFSV